MKEDEERDVSEDDLLERNTSYKRNDQRREDRYKGSGRNDSQGEDTCMTQRITNITKETAGHSSCHVMLQEVDEETASSSLLLTDRKREGER